MMSDLPISGLGHRIPLPTNEGSAPARSVLPTGGSGEFATALKNAISDVNRTQQESDVAIRKAILGEADLHSTIIAVQKAELSFQVMMEVRNKILSAYQELMRTQM